MTVTREVVPDGVLGQTNIGTVAPTTNEPIVGGSLLSILGEGREIGQRYRVIRLLGEGGMGIVYLVHDLELDRNVALKLIRAPLASDPNLLNRFKREIQLSSEITHPNVLRVYDLGESEGMRFLTMQFVEGEDLAAIIKREGTFPLDRLLNIFRQICEGLAAAHDKGVLHRDLKPQNIIVDKENHVYVMDFGLAKAIDRSGITQTGEVMGTPAYMSPEQVKGETLDIRSDIYSLGAILYEMITSRKPYEGGSVYEIMMRRVKTPPLPASEARPDIPAYLQNILDRCIAINKDLRYGSLREVIRDLDETRVRTTLSYKIRRSRIMKPVLLGLIAVLLAIAGIYLYRIVIRPVLQEGQTPSAVVSVPVLGVIPFENRTGDTGLDWYGEGIAQLIADNLARSRHIQVVSSSRIQTMRTAHRDPAALSKAMADGGIDYRVTGEILPGASGMTLAARVGETKEGRNVASRRIDGLSKEALIRAADQIAFTIKKGLNIPTTENVEAFSADYASRNPAAYEAYVAGLRAFAKYGYAEAEEAFRKALEEAPDYTMARYRLARVLMVTGRQEEAMQEIRRAMAESSRLPDLEQKYIRAVEAEISRHYEDAVEAYRQIITAYPYEIEARQRLAGSLMENGRPDEALEQLKFLTEMEPEIPTNWSVLGTIYLNGRKFNEAVTAFQRFAELKPESPNAHSNLGSAYLAQGEFDLAREEYNKAIAVDPEYHFAKIDLGVLYVLSGRYGEAEKQFETVVGNPHAGPRWRIEAAYDLSYLLRAQGRFRDSVRPLEALQKEIEKESIHEALALSIRGLSLMEIGDERGAASLIKRAIEKAPATVPPTRYLFARGLLELRQKKAEDVRKTALEILQRAQSFTSIDPSRKKDAEKASAYLNGMSFFIAGKLENAISELSRAVAMEGWEYCIYRLGLARAYLAAKRLPEALAAAKQSAEPLDSADPMIELEFDRVRAILVQAEVQLAMGRNTEAATSAKRFLEICNGGDNNTPDRLIAERIIQATLP